MRRYISEISVCGALVFIVIIIFFIQPINKKAYPIVFLGDSIIGNCRDATSVTSLVEQQLGKTVYNGGLGGTCAGSVDDIIRDSASLAFLADAIAKGDFSVVLAAQPVRKDGDLYYFEDTVRDLSRIDYSKTEILVIEHGVNDYLSGIPSGLHRIHGEASVQRDLENTETYAGALYRSVSMLKERYPNMRIILITPMYAMFGEIKADETNLGYGTLEDYITAEKMVAELLKVECLDMYAQGIVTEDNYKEVTLDGIHLNEEGRRRYATVIAAYLQGEMGLHDS